MVKFMLNNAARLGSVRCGSLNGIGPRKGKAQIVKSRNTPRVISFSERNKALYFQQPQQGAKNIQKHIGPKRISKQRLQT